MIDEPILLDTAYAEALLNKRDKYHKKAMAILPQIRRSSRLWITEAILVEIGNALCSKNRLAAVEYIRESYASDNVHVVSVDTDLLSQAVLLYESRPDKEWGLTDCISFVVMKENEIRLAATADHHFHQAGFRALMLENE